PMSCLCVVTRPTQADTNAFRAIEKACVEIVFTQGGQCIKTFAFADFLPINQALMNANRLLGFTAPTIQRTKCKLQVDSVGINAGGLGKSIDRPILLFFDQKIKASQPSTRQSARLSHDLPDINSRRH